MFCLVVLDAQPAAMNPIKHAITLRQRQFRIRASWDMFVSTYSQRCSSENFSMLFEPLLAHAKNQPDDLAVLDERGSHTFAQLAAMASGLGMYISMRTSL